MLLVCQHLHDLHNCLPFRPFHLCSGLSCRLWESAQSTAHSLPARLAVEHCVHEARGLDVLPSTVQKFRGNRDAESAALLEDIIYAVGDTCMPWMIVAHALHPTLLVLARTRQSVGCAA
jgi:hypothetical protein